MSHNRVDKRQVQRQFSRAAPGYTAAANIQHRMSAQLLALLTPHLPSPPARITDLGCGTGTSLAALRRRFPHAQLNGLDISTQMLKLATQTEPTAHYRRADIEDWHPDTPQDLLFANASIQWCDHCPVIRAAHQALAPHGTFAFSSFGPQTHRELAQAWAATAPADQPANADPRLTLPTAATYRNALENGGFQLLKNTEQLIHATFPNARALLDSIKKTGATQAAPTRRRGLLGRHRYRQFLDHLDRANPPQLSYQALFFIARKRQGD